MDTHILELDFNGSVFGIRIQIKMYTAVFQIRDILIWWVRSIQGVFRIRIHMFLGLLDPDPSVWGMDPDPSVIMQK
jgi:hypothetical protein